MLVKLEDGNLKDVRLTEVTPDNYIVPEGEEDVYHVMQEIVQFSPTTGQRLSHPRIQKYDVKMWEGTMRRQLKIGGYTTTVLYDPTNYIKEKAERDKAIKAEMLKPRTRMTDAEREKEFQDAVAKAVAAEIAKLSKQHSSKGKKDVNAGTDKSK